jgi:hypothetical protein
MRNLLRSWFGQRTGQAWPARALPRRRPEVEILEDRVVPSISFSGPGNTGVATITGTSGPDQFKIMLQQSGSTVNIVFSDGTTQQTAALSGITGVVVNGGGGKDTLTLDVGMLLNSTNFKSALPIQFNGGPGKATLDVVGNATGSNITETFTLGINPSPSTLTLSSVSGTTMTNLINLTFAERTSIADSLAGTNFIFNGNANNNLIHLQSQSHGGTSSLIIKGVNAQDNGANVGGDDDNEDEDDEGQSFTENETETTANAFAPLTLTNKVNVTVNGLGGDDLFVTNIKSLPAGLQSLTLDGGTGTNILVGRALPPGVTLLNITRQDKDDDDMFIDDLFAEMLERPADQSALNFFKGVLNGPGGRLGVITGIEGSDEARTDRLQTWFQHFLGRNLDDNARQFFLGLFSQGLSDEQIEAAILQSQEFQTRANSLVGAANQQENFVRALSRVLLNRDADDNLLKFFENVEQNNGAGTAALVMMQSQEFRTLATSGFFQTLLGRDLDDKASSFFTSLPVGLDRVFAMIAESDEFFNRS